VSPIADRAVSPGLRAFLVQHLERDAGTLAIRKAAGRGVPEEVCQGVEPLSGGPWGAPCHQIGEVDIRGEVLAAGVLIDRGAFECLLEKVGTDGAAGTAVVEILHGGW
jgi:hypothetical protein